MNVAGAGRGTLQPFRPSDPPLVDQVDRKGRSFRPALSGIYLMTDAPIWVPTEAVNQRLGLSRTTLDRLRAEGQLVAGTHWCWLSGQRNRKIGWDLAAVEQWQRSRAVELTGGVEAAK